MAVFKIEKQKNYTVMSNYHLQDRNLSYKAKGLLSFMLSLPEDWDYSLNGLVAVSKESKKAIRNILSELINRGYVVREQGRGEKGYYKYDYIIREIPVNVLEKDHPDTQKGDAVKGDTEKGTQINTNKENTKEQIDKIDKTINEKKSSKSAIKMISKELAYQLASCNIRVNCVEPGSIDTPLLRKDLNNNELINEAAMNIPMRRHGKPDEVADLILFLISDHAKYITGESIVIDGGLSLII